MSITVNSFSSINSIPIEKHSKPKFNLSLKKIEPEALALTNAATTEQINPEKIAGPDDWWTSERMKNAQPLKWYEGEATGISYQKTSTRSPSTTRPLTTEESMEASSEGLNPEKIAGPDDWWTSERMKNAQPLKWYEGEATGISCQKTSTRGTSITQSLTAEGSAETASVVLNRRKTAANASGWAHQKMQNVKPLTWYARTLTGVISNNTSIDTSI